MEITFNLPTLATGMDSTSPPLCAPHRKAPPCKLIRTRRRFAALTPLAGVTMSAPTPAILSDLISTGYSFFIRWTRSELIAS